METISGFTEVIESLQKQCPDGAGAGPPVSMERLQEQLRDVNSSNQALQAEVDNMKSHIEKFQASRRAADAKRKSSGPGPEALVHQLKDERDMLKARLEELGSSTSSKHKHDQQEQVHTQELKRLRQDVESLHNQNELLNRHLQDKEKEKEELQDNFLYVKGQLEKVQMKQAQGSGPGDGEAELQRHRQTLENVSQERQRLAHRLDGVLNNAEKEKAYHEQSVERVMTANARLMEERDRLAKEVERLSQMYAESVKQLQGGLSDTQASGLFRTESGAGTQVDPAEVARIRSELDAIAKATQAKEQENDSLKNRIRKLAVA